jgi:hypothetical protein
MRCRVFSEIRDEVRAWLRTAETAIAETPAARPTSARVAARLGFFLLAAMDGKTLRQSPAAGQREMGYR